MPPTIGRRTVGEAIRSPEARDHELVTRIPHPVVGWVPNVNLPIRYSRTPIVDPVAAPAVGQHTETVLRELLGYGDDRLARLAESGTFGADAARPSPRKPEKAKTAAMKVSKTSR